MYLIQEFFSICILELANVLNSGGAVTEPKLHSELSDILLTNRGRPLIKIANPSEATCFSSLAD
jgi:hypothetical protein